MRLCMVGCGRHATLVHGPSQQRCAGESSHIELAGCCDLRQSAAEAYRQRFGFARAYTSLHQMMDHEKPDAVVLACPPERTCELSCDILSHGQPLMIEKPPGLNRQELECIRRAAGPRSAMVAMNRRMTPLLNEMRRRLDPLITTNQLHQVHYDFVRYNRADADFASTAIHAIDAAAFLTGSTLAQVQIDYRDVRDARAPAASVRLIGTSVSGVQVSITLNPMAGAVTERAAAHARDRSIWVELPIWNVQVHPGRLLDYRQGGLADSMTTDQLADGLSLVVQGGFYGLTRAFCDAVLRGLPFPIDLDSCFGPVELADALRRRETSWTAVAMA